MNRDVFICYSKKDKTVADAVCMALESERIGCWIAPRDIPPGIDWGEGIIEAINHAKLLVLIFSSNANADQSQIKREIERAVHKDIPIIPIRIEDVMPVRALEYFLSTPHWLDAFPLPIENYLRTLVDAVRFQLEKLSGARPVQSGSKKKPETHTSPPPQIPKRSSGQMGQSNISSIPMAGFAAVAIVVLAVAAALFWWQRSDAPEDRRAWDIAARTDTLSAYEIYLREEADGYYADRAHERIDDLHATIERAWTDAQRQNTLEAMQTFIVKYGKDNIHVTDAWAAIHILRQQAQSAQPDKPEPAPGADTSSSAVPLHEPEPSSQSVPEDETNPPDLTLNCRSTSYPDEKTICQNAGLTALDQRMTSAYAALRSRQTDGSMPREVVSYAWASLKKRHECGTDVDCITTSLLAEKSYYENYKSEK